MVPMVPVDSVTASDSSDLLLFLEVGVDQGTDERSAGALHLGDDGADAIRSGTIKVSHDSDVLLQTSCVRVKA